MYRPGLPYVVCLCTVLLALALAAWRWPWYLKWTGVFDGLRNLNELLKCEGFLHSQSISCQIKKFTNSSPAGNLRMNVHPSTVVSWSDPVQGSSTRIQSIQSLLVYIAFPATNVARLINVQIFRFRQNKFKWVKVKFNSF